ncbi:aaRS-interacting multifunctional protein 2 isoform X2 [Leptinotarsa decemlineata]|uniref:aaRS-interacting multifunctional protein 2 isoform X2 n=1 Tax=Leptinotarsa decemlineata TaxID=7539 RepID=UPI003D30B3A9
MNGPIKMYRTTQIIKHDLPVELPKCMYALKNIHSNSKSDCGSNEDHAKASNKKLDIFDQNKQHVGGMAELEAKQEKILTQLAELKQQILTLRSSLSLATPAPSKMTPLKTNLQDIVINASPTNPPYSLEIIQKLFQDRVGLVFTTHLHSSISSLTEEAEKLQTSLVNFTPKTGVPVMNVRLIWKNVGNNLELLVTPLPILGEVNLLRYLVRVTEAPLNYDSDQDFHEIDSLLDSAYMVVKSRTKTERTSFLQFLNKSLGKSQWLAGRTTASIADIAAYSAIKQVSNAAEMTVNLGKWFQRCETLV